MTTKYFVVCLNSSLRANSVCAFYGAVSSGDYAVAIFMLSLILVPNNGLSQFYCPGKVGIVLCLLSPTQLVLGPYIIPACHAMSLSLILSLYHWHLHPIYPQSLPFEFKKLSELFSPYVH